MEHIITFNDLFRLNCITADSGFLGFLYGFRELEKRGGDSSEYLAKSRDWVLIILLPVWDIHQATILKVRVAICWAPVKVHRAAGTSVKAN